MRRVPANILLDALVDNQQSNVLLFTLKSGKVYLGVILRKENYEFDDGVRLLILTLCSGYRNKETNEIIWVRRFTINSTDCKSVGDAGASYPIQGQDEPSQKPVLLLPSREISQISNHNQKMYPVVLQQADLENIADEVLP